MKEDKRGSKILREKSVRKQMLSITLNNEKE